MRKKENKEDMEFFPKRENMEFLKKNRRNNFQMVFIYTYDPLTFEYDNDYDFISGYPLPFKSGDYLCYKPDSLFPDEKVYLISYEEDIPNIGENTPFCLAKNFPIKMNLKKNE